LGINAIIQRLIASIGFDFERTPEEAMNTTVHVKKYAMVLRSKLIDWLDKNPQKVATAQQWLGMLNNLQNVRREEKERCGIFDYLAKHHAPAEPIPVERIMEFIGKELCSCQPIIQSDWKRAFRPSLDVKNMTDQLPKRVEAKAKRFVEKAQACHQHPSIGYWIVRTGYEDLATVAPNWIVLDAITQPRTPRRMVSHCD
jgi:hypothetical protein